MSLSARDRREWHFISLLKIKTMYSNYSLQRTSKKRMVSQFQGKVGVFLTPGKKWLCKVKKGKTSVTLSQHETEKEALKAFNDFNLKRLD